MRSWTLLLISILGLSGCPALWAAQANVADFFASGPGLSLAQAAAEGGTDKLAALVAAGADVNSRGVEGMTPLLWALSRLSKPGVAWLLEHRANPNIVFSRDGSSATSFAAKLEDQWFLNEILAHGGDINLRNPLNGRTPLVEAMASMRHANVRTLIAAGADLNTVDTLGLTPLMEAAMNQKYDLVYDMLIAGADATFQPAALHGKTVLSVIRRSRVPQDAPMYQWQLKVIELLKQKGLDVQNGE
jgi:ankyrin repeat protein